MCMFVYMCLGHFSELQSSGKNKNLVLRISRSLQMCGLFRWGGAVAVVLWISWQGLSAALLCQEGLLLMFHHDVSVPLHALASVAECCYCGMGVVHIMTLRACRVLLCRYRAQHVRIGWPQMLTHGAAMLAQASALHIIALAGRKRFLWDGVSFGS